MIEREVKLLNNENITCCVQPSVWCDSEVLKIWKNGVLKQTFPHQKKLIIMDKFSFHKDNIKLIEYNDLIKVLFLLPNTTGLSQPLDISVNNLVKKNLPQFWIANFSKDRSLISRKEMAKRISDTWGSLTIEQIDSGFKKT